MALEFIDDAIEVENITFTDEACLENVRSSVRTLVADIPAPRYLSHLESKVGLPQRLLGEPTD